MIHKPDFVLHTRASDRSRQYDDDNKPLNKGFGKIVLMQIVSRKRLTLLLEDCYYLYYNLVIITQVKHSREWFVNRYYCIRNSIVYSMHYI